LSSINPRATTAGKMQRSDRDGRTLAGCCAKWHRSRPCLYRIMRGLMGRVRICAGRAREPDRDRSRTPADRPTMAGDPATTAGDGSTMAAARLTMAAAWSTPAAGHPTFSAARPVTPGADSAMIGLVGGVGTGFDGTGDRMRRRPAWPAGGSRCESPLGSGLACEERTRTPPGERHRPSVTRPTSQR
jgi:hypothetical protein